jgi:hypothetical protein
MSEYKNNAEANVSAAKGVTGGYCWRAPVGTALPSSPSWTPPSPVYTLTSDTDVDANKTYYTRSGSGTSQSPYTYAEVASPAKANLGTYYEMSDPWKCMGYITEDGETFATTSNVTEFRDQNGDLMDTSQSQYGETFACSFAETKAASFESIYGEDAVTDADGVLTVNHTGAEPGIYTYVFLFLLKDGRKWVRFAEKAKRTSIGDLTTNSSNVLAWNATFQVVRSQTTGGYFKDLFESTETEA